jgi:hypothetical protein
MGRRNKLRLVAVVALISAASGVGSVALAQSTPGTHLIVVMRDGGRHDIFTFGWKGISATAIYGHDEAFEKAKVRIVCLRECPEKLPAAEVREDMVTWRAGPPTSGSLAGVFCTDLDVCRVVQGDRQRSSMDMAYVQFAPQ